MAKSRWRYAYVVSFNLLLPGALGAALSWYVDAISAFFRKYDSSPFLMEWAFATWFTVYHGLWLLQSWQFHSVWAEGDAEPAHPRAYDGRDFLSDLADVSAVLAAFVLLAVDTQAGRPTPVPITALFACVLALGGSALAINAQRNKDLRLVLSVAGVAVGLAGALWNSLSPMPMQAVWGLLLCLYVIAYVYGHWIMNHGHK